MTRVRAARDLSRAERFSLRPRKMALQLCPARPTAAGRRPDGALPGILPPRHQHVDVIGALVRVDGLQVAERLGNVEVGHDAVAA